MVWNTIKHTLGLVEPTLPENEPTKLPDYFPVEPKGCEKHAQNLFTCLANEATSYARDMERIGVHKSYFDDVIVQPTDLKAVQAIQKKSSSASSATATATTANNNSNNEEDKVLPKVGDNPLDECRKFVAYYKYCCDRKLKRKENLILTEHVRVQDEYRYTGPSSSSSSSSSAAGASSSTTEQKVNK